MNNNTNYSNYEDLGLRDAQLIMASILKDVKKFVTSIILDIF